MTTMTTWATRLPIDDVRGLSRLRLTNTLRCAVIDDAVWVSGPDEVAGFVRHSLPSAEHYDVLDEGVLRIVGRRIPCGHLPEADWQPVIAFLEVALPIPALAGRVRSREGTKDAYGVSISLRRSVAACEPNGIVTDITQWSRYATCVAEVRLQRWRFAVCVDGRVVVTGVPLPAIRGERLVIDAGIAVPAGWTWWPAVDAAVLRESYGLSSDDVVLLSSDGTAERIEEDHFVSATRSAVRASTTERPSTTGSAHVD